MDKEFFRQIDQVDELYPLEKLDDQVLICECFCISAGDIRKFCAESRKVDIDALSSALGLGQGCQSCLKNSDFWIDKIF